MFFLPLHTMIPTCVPSNPLKFEAWDVSFSAHPQFFHVTLTIVNMSCLHIFVSTVKCTVPLYFHSFSQSLWCALASVEQSLCVYMCVYLWVRPRSLSASQCFQLQPRAKASIARGRACNVGRPASWTQPEYQRCAHTHTLSSQQPTCRLTWSKCEDGEQEGGGGCSGGGGRNRREDRLREIAR